MVSIGKLSIMNESHTTGELNNLIEIVHRLAPNTGMKNKIVFKVPNKANKINLKKNIIMNIFLMPWILKEVELINLLKLEKY